MHVSRPDVLSKGPYIHPLVGGRKVSHLHDNIKALSIRLTEEQIARLEAVKPFELGFPYGLIGNDPSKKAV